MAIFKYHEKVKQLKFWKTINNIKVVDARFAINLLFVITPNSIKMFVLDFNGDYLSINIASNSLPED